MKAPVPAPVIKRSLASASTVAHVMYQKYVNGMPLYRQEKDWANQRIVLSRETLANWVIRSATDWLVPLWGSMKSQLLKQDVIHADEPVIQLLKEEGKKPSSESGTKNSASGTLQTCRGVETAKANRLNVYMYLVHILSKMPETDFKTDPSLLEDLMPWSNNLPDYCRNSK